MAEEEKKKQRFYKIPVSEKNWRFLSRLSSQTQNAMFKACRNYITDVIEKLKQGRNI